MPSHDQAMFSERGTAFCLFSSSFVGAQAKISPACSGAVVIKPSSPFASSSVGSTSETARKTRGGGAETIPQADSWAPTHLFSTTSEKRKQTIYAGGRVGLQELGATQRCYKTWPRFARARFLFSSFLPGTQQLPAPKTGSEAPTWT